MLLSRIDEALRGTGLFVRGAFRPGDGDGVPVPATTVVLIGNAGAAMWRAFGDRVPEDARNRQTDPLDGWVRGIIEAIAGRFGAAALYPFEGPPFLPFQRWAMRAEPVHPSPLGILIHPAYGLWHAYRGALAFRRPLPVPARIVSPSSCASCRDKPCFARCPVSAFRSDRYDVAACVAHLRSTAGHGCRDAGCRARHACPLGRSYRYEPAQARFHMRGFLAVASKQENS